MDAATNLNHLYTPISDALKELEERRKDDALQAKVRTYFAQQPSPEEILSGPCTVVARPICTPNLELLHAIDVLQHIPLRSIFYECTSDRFVTTNPEKCSLLRLTFVERDMFTGTRKIGVEQVASFTDNEGREFKDAVTTTGESLVDFHHRLLSAHFGKVPVQIHNFNAWFTQSKTFDSEYQYLRYLGLFISDAILLEDFTLDLPSGHFTEKKVLPAIAKLEEVFGVRPLIVPLAQYETVNEAFWYYYPESIRALL